MAHKLWPTADNHMHIQGVTKIDVEAAPTCFSKDEQCDEFFTRKLTVFGENGKPLFTFVAFAHQLHALDVNFVGNDDVQS